MICEALVSTFIQCKKMPSYHYCIYALTPNVTLNIFSTSCFNKAHLLDTYFSMPIIIKLVNN